MRQPLPCTSVTGSWRWPSAGITTMWATRMLWSWCWIARATPARTQPEEAHGELAAEDPRDAQGRTTARCAGRSVDQVRGMRRDPVQEGAGQDALDMSQV